MGSWKKESSNQVLEFLIFAIIGACLGILILLSMAVGVYNFFGGWQGILCITLAISTVLFWYKLLERRGNS